MCCCAKSLQSCLTLCDPMDCSLPGSSVHGIPQARTLEWVAFPPPGDLPDPGIEPVSPELQVDSLPTEPPGKPQVGTCYYSSTQLLSDVMMNCRAFFAAFKHCPLNQGLCCNYEICG